ncbi:MAG: hypothetical protein ABTQ29_04895 [Siculibacillus sp.]
MTGRIGVAVSGLVVVSMLALGGCATRYQEMGATGGVTAAQMTDDVWRISVRGNVYTEETAMQDFLLLKAAETTIAAGRSHFVIVGMQDVGPARAGRQTGLYAFGTGTGHGLRREEIGFSRAGQMAGEDVMIRLLPPTATAEEKAKGLDAHQLVANIAPRVKRPQGAATPTGSAEPVSQGAK